MNMNMNMDMKIEIGRTYTREEGFPYFGIPTQVKITVDEDLDDETETLYGIAYCDKVICGCCGGIFRFDELNEIKVLPWTEIESTIKGAD